MGHRQFLYQSKQSRPGTGRLLHPFPIRIFLSKICISTKAQCLLSFPFYESFIFAREPSAVFFQWIKTYVPFMLEILYEKIAGVAFLIGGLVHGND
jgi:hypothetical protein